MLTLERRREPAASICWSFSFRSRNGSPCMSWVPFCTLRGRGLKNKVGPKPNCLQPTQMDFKSYILATLTRLAQLEGSRLASLPKQQSAPTRRPSSGSPSTKLNIWLRWSTSGPVARLQGVGGLKRSSTSQQISHFLQGTVASLMATMCFLPPKDTLGTQLTAMCTPPHSP